MSTLVTYTTKTGNTQMIAESIFEAIVGEKKINPIVETESLDGYDLVFVGFPVNMSGAPNVVKEFLQSKAQNKRLALFITHAMAPGTPALQPILNNCREAAKGADVVGMFDCQGILEEGVAEMLLKSPDPKLRLFGETRHMTVGHPDFMDRKRARDFTVEMQALTK